MTALPTRIPFFVLNHFSHNGNAVYDDFSHIAGKNGFLVSYDGMELEF